VGCYDALETIIYVSVSVRAFGSMISSLAGSPHHYEPIYWFVFYATSIVIHCYSGKWFWKINAFLAIISFLIILIYILGSIKWCDMNQYAPLEGESGSAAWFNGGMYDYLRILHYAVWLFVGVEGINIACQDVPSPKRNIPLGYLSCVWTLFFTGFGVFFVTISLPPGVSEAADSLSPLNSGFRLMFQTSEAGAIALSLPATYATAFGFMFFYGRQLKAMGKSGLLNPMLGVSLTKEHTPLRALLVGSVLGYLICLAAYFVPSVSNHLFGLCVMFACSVYFSQFLSYIVFKTMLSNIKRQYESPLGIGGALCGALMFSLVFISAAFCQPDFYNIIAFVIITCLASVYYVAVVKDRQFFSKEEQTVLMACHVVKSKYLCLPPLLLPLVIFFLVLLLR
jgi:ethanolamine permease